jgi:GT2 family glycosyltransferase/glycosyltransferase involved in cell wall biosynthesis
VTQHPQDGWLLPLRKRVQLVFRACDSQNELERLVVRRFVLRRATLGLFRLTRAAQDLDARITAAFGRKMSLSYASWLRLYQPVNAHCPGELAACAPASVVLHPAAAPLHHVVRCLRGLRRQHRPVGQIVLIGTTKRARLKARAAVWLAGEHSDSITIAGWPDNDLADEVLLLKGAPLLRPRALGVLEAALRAQPQAEAVYADEDQVSSAGFSRPFCKPDYAPLLGQQYDYVGNVALFRRDFFLRAVLPDVTQSKLPAWIGDPATARRAIIHLPDILHSEPTARRRSLLSGKAFDLALAATARRLPRLPSVAIVIPTKDRAGLLLDCIESIFDGTDYDRTRLSVVIVDNGSKEVDACRLLLQLENHPDITVLRRPGRFNYAWLCNQGAAACSAAVLVFMNNDIVIRDRDWLAKLAGAVALPGVGVVGCKLLYPTGLVQHAGVILGIQGLASHIGVGAAEHDGIYFDLANHTREVSAVTGALVGICADLFRRVGGYDERLAVAFNDTALCLACNDLGRQTLVLQSALAFHLESASRGRDDHELDNRVRLLEEFRHVLCHYRGFDRDPFYSANLSLHEAYQMAHPPRHAVRTTHVARKTRVLMLSSTFEVGHGVAVVVDMLARGLEERGCTVFIGAPAGARPMPWPAGRRFEVADPLAAARLAVTFDMNVVMSHTPPFYNVFQLLPASIASIAYDHGEPPPALFPDAGERRLVDARKFAAIRYADRLLAISEPVRQANPDPDCGLLKLGNTHLARWDAGSADRRIAARVARGWAGQLVLLNVCRFHESERCYKGVDFYVNLRRALDMLHPEIGALTRCVLAGKASRADAEGLANAGLDVIANPSDDMLADIYHACDLYVSFSRWEGYNLGIGQALALGLEVVASDIPAHRAFEITVVDGLTEAIAAIVRAFHNPARAEHPRDRIARLQPWEPSQQRLRQEIEILLRRGDLQPTVAWQDPTRPDVSIVIVNRFCGELTLLCLQHIWQNTSLHRYEIVIVDNGSDAEEVEWLRRQAPMARIIPLGTNRFFGEASNIGVEAARGRFVCLLNNDVVVLSGWLPPLMDILERDPEVGAVGPCLRMPDGALKEAGAVVHPDGSLAQPGKAGSAGDPARTVDYISAACALMRRETFLRVLGFDLIWEPSHYDDVDLCLKLRLIGLRAVCCSGSAVSCMQNAASATLDQSSIVGINRSKFTARWGRYLQTLRGETPHLVPELQGRDVALPGRAKRILIFTPFNLTPGGGERYILTIAEAFRDTAHVALVAPHPVSRIRLLTMGREFGLDLRHLEPLCLDDLQATPPFDLAFVLGNAIFPPVSRMARRNIFICQFPFPLDDEAYARHVRPFWNDFDLVLTYSAFVRSHVVREATARELAPRRIEVLSPPVPQMASALTKRPRQILHVGRFFTGGHCKRQDAMIDAFRALIQSGVKAELHLAGSTMSEPRHQAYYRGLVDQARGLPVVFHANCSGEALRQLYAESMIYWHATGVGGDAVQSPHAVEHFGISVVEAMSARCIPIVFAAGGPLSIVEDGVSGFHFQTLEQLTAKTQEVLERIPSATLNTIAAAASAAARAYDEMTFKEKLLAVSSELITACTLT